MVTIFQSLFLLLFFSLNIWSDTTKTAIKTVENVVIIPVDGTVDPGMAAFISKSIAEADSIEDPFFVIEMNTFGGRVDAALQIVDTLTTIPKGRSVAFVESKAISAGALIAFACSKLAMKPNTTIGDCAPISFTNEGPTMLGEKFQSPLRAKFRSLAKRNGYPEKLAESMVTSELMISKVIFEDTTIFLDSTEYAELSKKEKEKVKSVRTVVKRGELLTMDDEEAMNFGFSSHTVSSVEELLKKIGIEKYKIHRIEESWSVDFVRFIGSISSILIMIGLAALYTEVKSPGFGIPGIIGIISLALVFGSQYMIGMADHTEILLLFIGIVLLAAEVFIIPGFGIAGVGGILFIATGIMLSFQDFVIPKPEFPWQKEIMENNIQMIFINLFGAVILIVLFFKFLYPKLSTVIPGTNLTEDLSSAHIDAGIKLNVSFGDRAFVSKTLRPSGNVEIDGKSYDAITDGEFIDKNIEVQVIDIHGTTLIVKRVCIDE